MSGLTQTQVHSSKVKVLSQVKRDLLTAALELAAAGAGLEACAFKEPRRGGAGQEADSRETLPPARSFLGGRGGPDPLWVRPLSGNRVPLPPWAPGGVRAYGLWGAPGSASRPQRLKFVVLEGVAWAGAGANNTRSFWRRALQFTQLSPSILLN